MKYLNKKYIKKTYNNTYPGIIDIYIEDTRDNYIDQFALGQIGSITISVDFFQTNVTYDNEDIKEKILSEVLKELFGETKIEGVKEDYSKYYNKIKNMIEQGTMSHLGYKEDNIDLEQSYEPISRKHR